MAIRAKTIAALCGMALLVAGCAGTGSVEISQAESLGPVSVVVPEGWGSAELREGEVYVEDLDLPEGLEDFMRSDFEPWTLFAILMERETPDGASITSITLLHDDQQTCDSDVTAQAQTETSLMDQMSELGLEGETDVVIEPFDHPFWPAAVRSFRQAPRSDVGAIVERDYWLCTPDGLVAAWFVTDPANPEPGIALADETVRTIDEAGTEVVVR